MLETLAAALLMSLLAGCILLFCVVAVKRSRGRNRYYCGGIALLSAGSGLASLALASYLGAKLLDGQPESFSQSLAEGVNYERCVFQSPHLSVAHVITLNTRSEQELTLSTPVFLKGAWLHRADTTTNLLRRQGGDIAVNASFFYPFRDTHVFDYSPKRGDSVTPVGLTVWEANHYGGGGRGWPVLAVDRDGRIEILDKVKPSTEFAVSGNERLIRSGEVVVGSDDEPYPRTAVGLNRESRTMWFVVVDGKQPRYSMGMTLQELAAFMKQLGATDAINLDGGGSSTLAWRTDDGQVQLLNRPCHTKIPSRERPVANCLILGGKKSEAK